MSYMASTRRSSDPTDTDIREPEQPDSEMAPVPAQVEGGPTEGVSTLGGMFGKPIIVDEVETIPFSPEEAENPIWVIRTKEDIEDMTLGVPIVHMKFKAGVRYKVPKDVAYELARLDYLMEMPYPYDERQMARR